MVIENFQNIEFGICCIVDGEETIRRVPINDSVKEALNEMRDVFYSIYSKDDSNAELFQASERYTSTEKLTATLNNENLRSLSELYNHNNIPVMDINLSEIANNIVYYFAIFRLQNGTKQIAVKRPSQFKGLLKKTLLRFIDDTLQVVPDDVFKLDNDFDFIIHENKIEILHPTGFTFIANIEDEILRTAKLATQQLGTKVKFVDFKFLAEYVVTSKTAAKLIASIKSRGDLEKTSKSKLISMCKTAGITVRMEKGKIIPEDDYIINFLQILDRREYNVDLTNDKPEVYVAASRKKIR